MGMMRIDKYLANSGVGTRTQVKEYIRNGMVTINGNPVKKPEEKVDSEKDVIVWGGKLISHETFGYYMLNKPKGCVSATKDNLSKTVMDYLEVEKKEGYFPVGRLDKDTEGLVLLTNDGPLAHRLLSPRHHVDKVYYARVDGRVTQEDVRVFAEGMDIGEDRLTLPAILTILKAGDISEIEVTLHQGKFHQVKRMFAKIEKPVLYLKRVSMGTLKLDDTLGKGEYRALTEGEILRLKEEYAKK